MAKTMLGSECIIIPVDDARKLVAAFLKVFTLDHRTFTKTEVKKLRDDGVLMILDGLRDNVRDDEALHGRLLECGERNET